MYNRPRCRDWTALATQQLRLRSLIRITGHNIACNPKGQLYFTLHFSAMSAPFFTSEKVNSHGTGNVEWPEITCQAVLKSMARCVCIRVWEHNLDSTSNNEETNALRSDKCTSNDRMIFVWGVYFSGLVQVTKRSDLKFYRNSLAFQMHGGYFVSPETLTVDTVRQQLAINYELEQGANSSSLCKCSPHSEKGSKKLAKSSEVHISSESEGILKSSISKKSGKEFEINSPRGSRSCSPVRGECLSRVPCLDVNRDMLQMLKTRYLEISFLNSEIRPSYNLDRLLQLQGKQRKYKQKNEHAKEISDKICMKSAFCLNLDLISSKGFYYQPRGNPSMGRTLNRLLFQEHRVKPEDIMKAQELRRQIELARLRCQLLTQEKDRMRSEFRNFEKKLGELHDHTIEQESWLMSCYRNLSREKEALSEEKRNLVDKRETLLRTQRILRQRRVLLCKELQKIYPICETENGQFAISDVILPNTDHLLGDNRSSNVHATESVSPLSLSVALGYVAHVVHMCSVIYNLSLRNPVKHEGSRSRILDIVKEIPNSSRE